jgi:hypothetical protein
MGARARAADSFIYNRRGEHGRLFRSIASLKCSPSLARGREPQGLGVGEPTSSGASSSVVLAVGAADGTKRDLLHCGSLFGDSERAKPRATTSTTPREATTRRGRPRRRPRRSEAQLTTPSGRLETWPARSMRAPRACAAAALRVRRPSIARLLCLRSPTSHFWPTAPTPAPPRCMRLCARWSPCRALRWARSPRPSSSAVPSTPRRGRLVAPPAQGSGGGRASCWSSPPSSAACSWPTSRFPGDARPMAPSAAASFGSARPTAVIMHTPHAARSTKLTKLTRSMLGAPFAVSTRRPRRRHRRCHLSCRLRCRPRCRRRRPPRRPRPPHAHRR